MAAAAVENLKAQAVEKTGLTDFGDPWIEAPLAAWVHDLRNPLLSERGRAFFTRLAVNNLCRRLEVTDCLKRNPAIGPVPIPPILYITGLERSGTTFLHNLRSKGEGPEQRPSRSGRLAARRPSCFLSSLPEVALLTDCAGFDGARIEGVMSAGPSGIVVAGFAGGRLSAGGRRVVERAASTGIPVVVASHVPGSRIVGNPVANLRAAVARDLSPNKARILLMLALTRTRDVNMIQRMFDTY